MPESIAKTTPTVMLIPIPNPNTWNMYMAASQPKPGQEVVVIRFDSQTDGLQVVLHMRYIGDNRDNG